MKLKRVKFSHFRGLSYVDVPEDWPHDKVERTVRAMRDEYDRLRAVGIDASKKGDFK